MNSAILNLSTNEILNSGTAGTKELRLLAEQITGGNYLIAAGAAAPPAKRFIEFYESPDRPACDRRLAATAAGVLAWRYPAALDLVMESAERYAYLMSDIGDADPYCPNGLTVLKDYAPSCQKIIPFLKGLLEKYPGMVGADVVSALESMRAALNSTKAA
jgi:hypothetical protein